MLDNTYCSSIATMVRPKCLDVKLQYVACIVIFVSYQQATLNVSIQSSDKPVKKYVYSSSRLFAATWGYVNEMLTSITVL
jgi:hypothetical protein